MKEKLPILLLLILILGEAFLKKYLQYSPSFQSVYPYVFPPAFGIFIVSVAGLTYYFHKNAQAVPLWESFSSPFNSSRKNYWILAGILLLGILFRFWKLGNLFDGMTYDEAYKGLDGIAIRTFGERPVFLDWNGGREALVAYLVAASQSFFDYSIISVRIITPILNCLVLLFFYLFAKTIFNTRVALLSTFLLAVSKWHIIHSRYGVRASQFLFFEMAVLYFVARGLASEKKNSKSFIVAGFFAGLGFHTYIAYRIFPLILLSFLFQKDILRKLKNHTKTILAGCIVALIIVAPLAQFYFEHRESFTDRMKNTLVWNQKGKAYEGIHPVILVLRSAKDTLGMFTFKGDFIARHNVGIEPMLSPFESSFFILGFILVCLNIRNRHALFLLLFFFLSLLPGIFSVHAPNTPRVLAAIPPSMLFITFGILGGMRIIRNMPRFVQTGVLALILLGNFYTGANDALIRHPEILDTLPAPTATLWGMDREQTDIAELLNTLGQRCDVYLTPQFFFHSTVQYLTYSKSQPKLFTFKTNLKESDTKGKIAMVIFQPRTVNLWWLRDDGGKNFFKWWQQVYGMDAKEIRSLILKTYGNEVQLAQHSDRQLLPFLKKRRVLRLGKVVNFPNYSIFIAFPEPRQFRK